MNPIQIATVLTLACFTSLHALSLSSVMEAYEKQHCFYATVDDPKSTLHFYYSESVSKLSRAAAGSSPVKLQVFGPTMELLQDHPPKSVLETTLQPTVAGEYAFCLLHGDKPGRRVLDVDLTEQAPEVKTVPGQPIELLNPDPLAVKLERTNQKLRSDLEDMLHTLKYIKNREKRNMETVEETNSRVWWFSMLECVLVVGIAVLQVTVLRQLFGTGSRPRV